MNTTYDVPLSECIQVSPHLYLLPSESDLNVMHEINVDIGLCTCLSGRTGAFCKHQCFLFTKLNLELPNAPVLNLSDRLLFAYLASGQKDLDEDFYKNNSEENFSSTSIHSTLLSNSHQEEQQHEVSDG